jgi:hypothetical protein
VNQNCTVTSISAEETVRELGGGVTEILTAEISFTFDDGRLGSVTMRDGWREYAIGDRLYVTVSR